MSLPTGLYKIAFKSSYGADFGVVLLMEDGKLRGGDSGMATLARTRCTASCSPPK